MPQPPSDLSSALPLLVLLIVTGALLLFMTREGRYADTTEIKLFFVACVVRFATSLLIYEVGFVEIIGDEDAQEWINGVNVKRDWDRYQVGILGLPWALLDAFDSYNRGYMFMLAALYSLWDFADPGRLVAAAVNSVAGGFTVSLIYRAARDLFDTRVASIAGWLNCFFPSLIVWSAQTIKEPVIILLETVVLYACIRLTAGRPAAPYLLLSAAAVVLISPFRFYGAYLAAGILVATFLMRVVMAASPSVRRTMGASTAIFAVLALCVMAIVFAQREQHFDFNYLMRYRDYSATMGSGVAAGYDVDTPFGFGMSALVGAMHVLFAPLPWQWAEGSLRLTFTIPEVVVWWIIFFFGVWPGLRRAIRDRFVEVQPVLLFLLGFGLLYSLLFGNVGLAYRQRAQLLPWLLIFGAAGLDARWRARRARRASALAWRDGLRVAGEENARA